MDIIKQLQTFRFENKLSQEKLASLLGVHFTSVNRWFNGRQKPNEMQTYQIKKLIKEYKKK